MGTQSRQALLKARDVDPLARAAYRKSSKNRPMNRADINAYDVRLAADFLLEEFKSEIQALTS